MLVEIGKFGIDMVDFKDAEHDGWVRNAAAYDDHFARITAGAIPTFLDCAGNIDGSDVLGVCCGTGDLAQAMQQKHANVTAVDFAEPMVSIARSNYPGVTFSTGDAEALDIDDHSHDLVTCAFGLWHLAQPDLAVAEAARILRPGGRYIYSAWTEQTQNHQVMRLISDAVQRHGRMDVDMPPAPPPYRFAIRTTAYAALHAVGFTQIEMAGQSVNWVGESGQELLQLIMKSTVRAPMIINAQTPDARKAIVDEIVKNAEALKQNGTITLDWPYVPVVATT